MGRYDDIINENQPPLHSHTRMKREDRASQFAPFSAMVGHDKMIAEAMRYVGKRVDVSEDEKTEINDTLTRLLAGDITGELEVTYFKPDERKIGGEYVRARGEFMKIKLHEGVLILKDGLEIKIEELKRIIPVS